MQEASGVSWQAVTRSVGAQASAKAFLLAHRTWLPSPRALAGSPHAAPSMNPAGVVPALPGHVSDAILWRPRSRTPTPLGACLPPEPQPPWAHASPPPPLQAIRNSSRFTPDYNTADFIFVDMHCYHSAWMAWLHPLNEEGRKLAPSPEFYIKRALTKMQGMRRCVRPLRLLPICACCRCCCCWRARTPQGATWHAAGPCCRPAACGMLCSASRPPAAKPATSVTRAGPACC